MSEVKSKIGGIGDEEYAKAACCFSALADAFTDLSGIQQIPMSLDSEVLDQHEHEAGETEREIEGKARMIYLALTGKKPRALTAEDRKERHEGCPIFMGAGECSGAQMGAIYLLLAEAINKLMANAMSTAPIAAKSIYMSLTGVEPKFKT